VQFGSGRIALKGRDKLSPPPLSAEDLPRHIVVLARGRFFKVDLIAQASGAQLTVAALEARLRKVLDMAAADGGKTRPCFSPPSAKRVFAHDTHKFACSRTRCNHAAGAPSLVSVLSAMDRDAAAALRASLTQPRPPLAAGADGRSETNAAAFAELERALCVVVLEEADPQTLQEKSRLALHGGDSLAEHGYLNRWFDKHNFVFCANEGATMLANFEHAFSDGMVGRSVPGSDFELNFAHSGCAAGVQRQVDCAA
jgi:hypothetical protein